MGPEAIADPALACLINVLMREEAARSFMPAPGQDLDAYADQLLARLPIAPVRTGCDRSPWTVRRKFPQRWLDTLRGAQSQGRCCEALLQALGAWLAFVRGDRVRSRIRQRRNWPAVARIRRGGHCRSRVRPRRSLPAMGGFPRGAGGADQRLPGYLAA